MDALKEQIGGDHYRSREIQPIEFILANNMGFCEGSVVKYVTRWQDKGGVEDLRKAKHYLEFLLEKEEGRAKVVTDSPLRSGRALNVESGPSNPMNRKVPLHSGNPTPPRAIDNPYPDNSNRVPVSDDPFSS
jgi:hypothetical protein